MKKIMICFAFSFVVIASQAQQLNPATDLIEWSYTQLKNLRNNEDLSIDGKFRVHGSEKIEWIQKDNVLFTFQIDKTNGRWTNVEKDGSITYLMTYEQSTGTIKITRTGSDLKIELDIDNPGRPNTQYVFYINSVQSFI